MPNQTIPPPPPGFVLIEEPEKEPVTFNNVPPPPPGFILTAPEDAPSGFKFVEATGEFPAHYEGEQGQWILPEDIDRSVQYRTEMINKVAQDLYEIGRAHV